MAACPSVGPGWGQIDFDELQRRNAIAAPAFRRLTQVLLQGARLEPGLAILDLACGTGTPALSEARAVGPTGRVVGIDVSVASLELARRTAVAEGVAGVTFREANAETLPFPDGSFDRVTSRFGPMFFPHLDRAVAEAYRVLRPGGRLAWLVWGRLEEQTLFRATAMVAVRHAGLAEPPPEMRQPFCFADGGALRPALRAAGFVAVRETRRRVAQPWPIAPEALAEYWWSAPAPPFQPTVARLDPSARRRAMEESVRLFREEVSDGQVQLEASVILVVGERPRYGRGSETAPRRSSGGPPRRR